MNSNNASASHALPQTYHISKSAHLNAHVPVFKTEEPLLLYQVPHVLKYNYIPDQGVVIESQGLDATPPPPTVLVIDTCFDDAFGHWVYESAIYLPLYLRLKTHCLPHLKLHVKHRQRRYKYLFYDFFGIQDLVFDYQGATCIVPLPISSWNDRDLSDVYKHYVNEFFDLFAARLVNIPKTVSVLCSPRAKQENYPGNDRQINVSEIEKELQGRNDAQLLYVDQVVSLSHQMEAIAQAKCLILMDGSAYYVNGLWARNSHILVVGGTFTQNHSRDYPKMGYIDQQIRVRNQNQVDFACSTHYVPYSSVERFLT